MEKITYLVRWGKNKETAWSGTNYSLFKALSKYYQVDDVNLKFPKLISVLMYSLLRLDWFAVSDFQNANLVLLNKQAIAQSRFYNKCTGIFCMGHWLRKFLIESGLPESKVIYFFWGVLTSTLVCYYVQEYSWDAVAKRMKAAMD